MTARSHAEGGGAGERPCAACGAPLAADQRWCLDCGARGGGGTSDPRTLLFGASAGAATAGPPDAAAVRGAAGGTDARSVAPPGGVRPIRQRPPQVERRRRAAVPIALAALVGLFVTTGSGANASLGQVAPPGLTVFLPAVAQQLAERLPVAEEPVDDAPLDETPLADAPVDEPAADTPAATDDEPADDDGDDEEQPAGGESDSSPVRHVFLVVLGSTDVGALTRDEQAAPYLAGTLAKSGTLLTDYRAVARGSLANRIAMVSGQGPTNQTLADCTAFADVRPADALLDGQTGGDGCVYGYETGTVGDQLRGIEKTWRAYVEPAGATTAASTPRAGAAASPASRAASTPRATAAAGRPCALDAATTRRNPFLWFRGTAEADDCTDRNVPLDRLERDLADPDTAPALVYIASDAQAGSAEADAFLERVVPVIQNSLTYANGGLIVITSDQPPPAAPTDPPASDPAPPMTTPTDPAPSATTPTTTTPTPDATATPAPDPTGTPAPDANATPTPDPTGTPAPDATATPTPTPASSSGLLARAAAGDDAAATPWPATYPNVGDAAAAGAGAPVGALLISPFTPAGRTDDTPASHFTLLRTIEQVFGVDPLGYAGADGVDPLPDRLFDAPQ